MTARQQVDVDGDANRNNRNRVRLCNAFLAAWIHMMKMYAFQMMQQTTVAIHRDY